MFQGHRYAQGISDKKELAGGGLPAFAATSCGVVLGESRTLCQLLPETTPSDHLEPGKAAGLPTMEKEINQAPTKENHRATNGGKCFFSSKDTSSLLQMSPCWLL